jgi:hypothetical protein
MDLEMLMGGWDILYIVPSLQGSKQRDIGLLEDLSRMRCPSYGMTLYIPAKIENLFIDMIRTILHQSDDIFVDKFLETMQLVEIEQEHHTIVLSENFHVDV